MSKLREVVGDNDGYAVARNVPLAREHGTGDQTRRYAQECGPVETKPLVTWFGGSKSKAKYDFPYLCIHKNRRSIGLNRLALDLWGRPPAVRIGITYDGRLAITPTDKDDADGHHIVYLRRSKGGMINRPRLMRRLAENGMAGRYRLVWDEKLDLFVGEPAT